jgi:S-formylglutathione hydrolase FrmB
MRRNAWKIAVGLALTAISTCLAPGATAPAESSSPAAPQLTTITIPGSAGEIPAKWLGYPGPPRANVLLPAGYNPDRRYPLLVLLHGLNSNYDWVAQSGLIKDLYGLDAIVVMPEGGSGWYTDWWNGSARGTPAWESYELNDVIPTILTHYPILPQRRYHAIAGVSMGGLGAVYLAGRLPGFFGSVASLSGFVDLGYFPALVAPGMGLTALAPFKGNDNINPVDGPPDGFYFNGHNPALLTENLEQTRVFESSGTGVPSSAGLSQKGSLAQILEGSVAESLVIYPMNQLYHAALVAAGVDVTYQPHPGGHDNPDFSNEFAAMLSWGLFQPVVGASEAWANKTVASSGQLWSVGYHFDRPPDDVVEFRQSGSTLSVSAAGSPVTITVNGHCPIRTNTPATITIPGPHCT